MNLVLSTQHNSIDVMMCCYHSVFFFFITLFYSQEQQSPELDPGVFLAQKSNNGAGPPGLGGGDPLEAGRVSIEVLFFSPIPSRLWDYGETQVAAKPFEDSENSESE